MDYASKYVWRGMLSNDEPVLQPAFTVEYKGLSANIWGSIDLTDYGAESENYNNRENSFQEIDYTVSYSYACKKLSADAGTVLYDFPGTGWDDTKEIFFSISLSLPVSPSITISYDYDEAEGFYISSGAEYSHNLTETLSFGLSTLLGWADSDYNLGYYGVNESAFSDIELLLSLDSAFNETFTLSPYIKYSKIIDNDLDEAVVDPEILFFGVNFLFSF